IGISKSASTYQKYEVTRKHLENFIRHKYNLSDIALQEINLMFITDFEVYLKTICKCNSNTTAKFMQFFKRIVLIARNNGIVIGDPFANYKIRLQKVDRGYLMCKLPPREGYRLLVSFFILYNKTPTKCSYICRSKE